MKNLLYFFPDFVTRFLMRKKVSVREDGHSDFIFKIATSREELEQAYSLLQKVYVSEGYADPEPSRVRLNRFFASPHTTTMVGKKGDRVIITGTIFPDSDLGLPMDALYSKELDVIRNEGRYIGEVGCLASHPKFRKGSQLLPMLTNKIMHTYARQYLKLDDFVVTVNPKHQALYKNILLFNRLGENKPYGAVNGHVAVPLRLDLVKMPQTYHSVYKNAPKERDLEDFFLHRKSEQIKLPPEKEPLVVWHEKLFRYFFVERTGLLSSLGRNTQDSLLELYDFHPGIRKLVRNSMTAENRKNKKTGSDLKVPFERYKVSENQ